MRVYLAGPMRGLPEFNFPAFDAGAAQLEDLGHVVFSPAERDRRSGFDTTGMTGHENLAKLGFNLRKALAFDTTYIAEMADAIALLPGWEHSSGAAAEIALAHALGLPVGELADFDKDGPSTTLEAPHAPSGTISPETWAEMIPGLPRTFQPKRPWDNLWGTKPSTEDQARVIFAKTGSAPAFTSDSPTVTFSKGGVVTDLPPSTGEVRTTSSTGGEKGTKPERYDLIPVSALATVASLYGQGAAKYAAHNWRRGYEWSKSYAALQRHATQFWNGEDNDTEMGLPHMASVAFHALALLTFMEEQRTFDDRFKPAGETA